MTINNQSKTTLINKPIFNLSLHCQQVSTKRGSRFRKLLFILLYFGEYEYEFVPYYPPKIQIIFTSGLTIGIRAL